jgi:UDP-glucose 4-epimerase
VRDYVHVADVAEGHVVAVERLAGSPGVHTYNLGTGSGRSVLEVVKAFEEASGKPVPYEIVDRRSGDVAESWADVSKVADDLGWRAARDLPEMCSDAWRWQQQAR